VIFQIILVQVIVFIGMAFILVKFLASSSYKETNRLQQLNEENEKKSKELAGKLIDAENEHREKMAKAEKEIQEMKAKARKETEELKEAIIARGKAESEQIIAQALGSKKELRREVEEEMYGNIVEFSSKIFQRVLGSEEQRLVYDGLLESVFQELGEIEKSRLSAVDLGGGNESTVEVKSSHPMSPKQKEKLESILSSKLDQTIRVKEVIEKEVIAGIIIKLGSFSIDGSLLERFRRAAEEIRNA